MGRAIAVFRAARRWPSCWPSIAAFETTMDLPPLTIEQILAGRCAQGEGR